jgi:hypothetical protein
MLGTLYIKKEREATQRVQAHHRPVDGCTTTIIPESDATGRPGQQHTKEATDLEQTEQHFLPMAMPTLIPTQPQATSYQNYQGVKHSVTPGVTVAATVHLQ